MNIELIKKNTKELINILKQKIKYEYEQEIINTIKNSFYYIKPLELKQNDIAKNEIIKFVKNNICIKLIKYKNCYMDSDLILKKYNLKTKTYEFVLEVHFYEKIESKSFSFIYIDKEEIKWDF